MGKSGLHIVLDLQACQSPESGRRGIGRYSLALAKAIAADPHGHRITLLLNSAMSESIEYLRSQFRSLLPQDAILVWRGLGKSSSIDPSNAFRRRASELLRRDALRSLKPDIVHVASLIEGFDDDVIGTISKQDSYLTAATLYDLIPLAHKEMYLADQGVNRWYMEKIGYLMEANQFLGISRFSCDEAKTMLSIPEDRLTDISAAADDIFVRQNDPERFRVELMARYGIRKSFVMYAGGFDARKNIGALIRAFARLPGGLRSEHQLVIVGGAPAPERTALQKIAADAGLSPTDVVFAGYVPDADLVKLYNLCALYAFPSLQEGFGLPALEAMCSGAVVIGSGTSSLPEVIGIKEALFDPRDDVSISMKMETALLDQGFRSRFLEHARGQVRKFSWAESARRAIEAMELAFDRDAAQSGAKRTLAAVPARRTALLPAPRSSLLDRMPQARIYADQECGDVSTQRTLASLADDRRKIDRIVIELVDHPYCAKTLKVASEEIADIVVGSPRLGRALAALAGGDRARLLEIVYRAGGYEAIRKSLEAEFDADTLAELVPPQSLDQFGQSQIVSVSGLGADGSFEPDPWRGRVDQMLSKLLDDDASDLARDEDWASVAVSIAANTVHVSRRKHWFVDISNLVVRDAGTGIQRVVRHVLDELIARPPEGCRVEPISLGDDGVFRYARSYCQKRYFPEEELPADEVVEFVAGDVYLGLDLVAHLIPAYIDRFRALRAVGVNLYFVVYDLLPLLRPDCFEQHLLPLFRSWYESIAEISDGVMCISRAVADEFESWLHQSRPPRQRPLGIGWFHLGADLSVSALAKSDADADDGALSELGPGPTFLMVGTIEPRKGHEQALGAFELLWEQGQEVNLLVIGKPGWLVEELLERLRQHPMRGKRLFWFENAGDDLLLAGYQRASALLMASEGEGFGLPLIEAAHRGVPLIARDIPVFREIAGEHAHYFQGYDAGSLAGALKSWMEQDARGVASKPTRMRWMTWAEASTQMVNVVSKQLWTHCWTPGSVRRFSAFDYRFQTQVGHLRRSKMESTGQAGILIYGPYVPLSAGRYVMEVFGDGSGNGCVDVCSAKGQKVHAIRDFELSGTEDVQERGLVRLDFTLEWDVPDLEVRVAVGADANLQLSCIEIWPNSSVVATSESIGA